MPEFDTRAAKNLHPGDHLTVAAAPGLRLLATATTRTWTYRYRSPVDGKVRQVRLGRWPAMGLGAAIAAWDRFRQARQGGSDPSLEKRAQRAAIRAEAARESLTVRRVCDEYLAAYRGTVGDRAYHEMNRLFTVELDSVQALPAASLTRAHAFALIDAMRPRPVIARRLRQGLGAAWDHALDAGLLPPDVPNWWRLVLRGKLPTHGKIVQGQATGGAKRVLSEAEVGEVLRWLPNLPRDIEDILTLYLWTACRGAEIVAFGRAEVTEEPDGFWWTVPRARLKMRRNPLTTDLRVPLVGRALAVVQRRLQATDGPLLFPSGRKPGLPLEQKSVGVAVWARMPYCKMRKDWIRSRWPVTHWAPHDLRRTSRTMLAALGCPTDIAEVILGHQQPGVQAVYNRHGYDAERRVWLTRLAERLESLA